MNTSEISASQKALEKRLTDMLSDAVDRKMEDAAIRIVKNDTFLHQLRVSGDFRRQATLTAVSSHMPKLLNEFIPLALFEFPEKPDKRYKYRRSILRRVIEHPDGATIVALEDSGVITIYLWMDHILGMKVEKGRYGGDIYPDIEHEFPQPLVKELLEIDHPMTWPVTRPGVNTRVMSGKLRRMYWSSGYMDLFFRSPVFWENIDAAAEYVIKYAKYDVFVMYRGIEEQFADIFSEAWHRVDTTMRKKVFLPHLFFGACTVCGAYH